VVEIKYRVLLAGRITTPLHNLDNILEFLNLKKTRNITFNHIA
jgi:hypothetical protein